jgi:multiple sugar transport system substrate-binding protein
MKKFLVIFTLFISSIASAGTLVVATNQSGEGANAAFKQYVADFEAAHPEVTVVLNEYEGEAYKVAIRNFLTSETPDVALWFAGNRMKYFVDQELLMDVSDVWEDYGLYDSMASSKLALTVDDKQYGVPWGYYQWGMYYRTDIFENVGLSVPTNFEELIAACSTLRENNIVPVAIGTRYLWTAAGWFDYLNMRVNGYEFHIFSSW